MTQNDSKDVPPRAGNKKLAKILLICFGPVIVIAMGALFYSGHMKNTQSPSRYMPGDLLHCAKDMIGCHIDRPRAVPESNVKPNTPSVMDKFQCHSDDECVVTPKGGCAVKGMFSGAPNSDKKCECLTGPVIFGCLPHDQAKLYKGQGK